MDSTGCCSNSTGSVCVCVFGNAEAVILHTHAHSPMDFAFLPTPTIITAIHIIIDIQ